MADQPMVSSELRLAEMKLSPAIFVFLFVKNWRDIRGNLIRIYSLGIINFLLVFLVGFPNAGKSTLLSVISAAKPKIADYPFTTLIPNIGIVEYRDNKSFVMAVIPGIIEGAHEGKGLGLRFLRHIERNSMLLFMIPADTDNIHEQYDILLNELKMFNPELLDKKRVLAITKSDLIDDELKEGIEKDIPDLPYIFISSQTG